MLMVEQKGVDMSDPLHALAALPMGKRPCTHCTGGWAGHRAGIDRCGEEKVSRAYRSSNLERLTRTESLYRRYPGPRL